MNNMRWMVRYMSAADFDALVNDILAAAERVKQEADNSESFSEKVFLDTRAQHYIDFAKYMKEARSMIFKGRTWRALTSGEQLSILTELAHRTNRKWGRMK